MNRVQKIVLGGAAAAALVAAIVLLALGALGGGSSSPGSATTEAPAGTTTEAPGSPSSMRTLLVSTDREPAPSPPGSTLHGLRLKGVVPGRPTIATVLTDEDCAPDAHGISHCRNKLRLPGGRTLVVRHPHRMMDVACLTPGEHVMVRS